MVGGMVAGDGKSQGALLLYEILLVSFL